MPSETLPPPTQAEIERAIDEVVSTLVAYRAKPPKEARRANEAKPGSRSASASQLVSTELDVLAARDLAWKPVEHGLKHSLRDLGKLLHAIVGDEGMLEAAERVCDLDKKNWARRMSPIDAAWNGIGSWYS